MNQTAKPKHRSTIHLVSGEKLKWTKPADWLKESLGQGVVGAFEVLDDSGKTHRALIPINAIVAVIER